MSAANKTINSRSRSRMNNTRTKNRNSTISKIKSKTKKKYKREEVGPVWNLKKKHITNINTATDLIHDRKIIINDLLDELDKLSEENRILTEKNKKSIEDNKILTKENKKIYHDLSKYHEVNKTWINEVNSQFKKFFNAWKIEIAKIIKL